jgi:hypothetical protein
MTNALQKVFILLCCIFFIGMGLVFLQMGIMLMSRSADDYGWFIFGAVIVLAPY